MKTFFGIIIGIVVTLAVIMGLTVWDAHRRINEIDQYLAEAIQKRILPTQEALRAYQPPAPKAEVKK